MAKNIFNFETETIATLTSLESVINENKSISSDAVAMAKNAKLDQYSIMIHTVYPEILNNSNSKLTKTTTGKIKKALKEDVGMKDATIKRLIENSVNLCRKSKSKNEKLLTIPTQATVELIKNILDGTEKDKNIVNVDLSSEAKIASFGNPDNSCPLEKIVQSVVGKWSYKTDTDKNSSTYGERIKSKFVEKLSDDDLDTFKSILAQYETMRIEQNAVNSENVGNIVQKGDEVKEEEMTKTDNLNTMMNNI